MKITKQQLKDIIKEEIQSTLSEDGTPPSRLHLPHDVGTPEKLLAGVEAILANPELASGRSTSQIDVHTAGQIINLINNKLMENPPEEIDDRLRVAKSALQAMHGGRSSDRSQSYRDLDDLRIAQQVAREAARVTQAGTFGLEEGKITKSQLKEIIKEELETVLNEKTFTPSPPKGYKGDVKAAQKRAADSVKMQDFKSRSGHADPTGGASGPDVTRGVELAADTTSPAITRTAKKAADVADTSISTTGKLAKGLKTASNILPGIGLAGGARSISNTLGDREASTIQKGARIGSEVAQGAADLASIAPNLATRTIGGRAAGALTGPAAGAIGAALAGYEGGKALQKPLAKAGVIPDLGKTIGVTDIDIRPSAIKGAFTGGDHTGGTQVDLDTMKGPEGQRLGPKGKPLDAPEAPAIAKVPTPSTPPGLRDDDEDEDILTLSKNLAEVWGFEMDLTKLDEKSEEKKDDKFLQDVESTGEWTDYTIAQLQKKKDTLMKKEKRTADEVTTVRQLNFAINAKQGDYK